jgi:hypothetical protein
MRLRSKGLFPYSHACIEVSRVDAFRILIDHRHLGYGQISLMNAIGTTSEDFLEGLILQLVNAARRKSLLSGQ